VPYFLVSCAQGLLSGALTGAGEGDIPWNVVETVRQRLAVLPEPVREVLDAAAAVGRVAPRALLAEVAGIGGPGEKQTLQALEAACQARLLVEEGARAYAFAHDLIREVVTANMGLTRRALLHRKVAEVLERAPGEPPVEALVYHYEQAGEQEKTIPYLERAAERAARLYAHAEAEDYYACLVARLDELGRKHEAARAREKLSRVIGGVGRYDEGLAVLERAVAAYRALGDREGLRRATGQLAEGYGAKGMPLEGLAVLEPLLDTVADLESSADLAVLYWQLAWLNLAGGRYGKGLERRTARRRWRGRSAMTPTSRAQSISAQFCCGRWGAVTRAWRWRRRWCASRRRWVISSYSQVRSCTSPASMRSAAISRRRATISSARWSWQNRSAIRRR
jgi:hypothetical protein